MVWMPVKISLLKNMFCYVVINQFIVDIHAVDVIVTYLNLQLFTI